MLESGIVLGKTDRDYQPHICTKFLQNKETQACCVIKRDNKFDCINNLGISLGEQYLTPDLYNPQEVSYVKDTLLIIGENQELPVRPMNWKQIMSKNFGREQIKQVSFE